MKGTHVVVTGASSGIGAAIARVFSEAGASITLVARRESKLRELAAELSTPTHVVAADLSDPGSATDLLEGAIAALGPIDVLVNNAGVQIIGSTHTIDVEAAERATALNLLTPLRLTRAVLPAMVERDRGTIVNVASMAALAPTPGMTWYNAGKAGLAAASESLRGELKDTGVEVLTVYPGIIPDTDMGRAGLEQYDAEANVLLRLQPTGTPRGLAERILRAVERRHARLIWPKANALARHFPAATRWMLDAFTPRPAAT